MEAAKQVHNIPPLYDENSRILVLGSFPSIASREAAFFYGHPQNRYWKVMPTLLGEPLPETVEEKAAMMHRHHIAMWDTIGSCTITGSSDSSITDVVPNDLSVILETARIEAIFTNGAKSTDLQQPESAEHLCEKCKEYASCWAPIADRLWEEREEKIREKEKVEKEQVVLKKGA